MNTIGYFPQDPMIPRYLIISRGYTSRWVIWRRHGNSPKEPLELRLRMVRSSIRWAGSFLLKVTQGMPSLGCKRRVRLSQEIQRYATMWRWRWAAPGEQLMPVRFLSSYWDQALPSQARLMLKSCSMN